MRKYTYFDLSSAEQDLNQSLVLPSIPESIKIKDSRSLTDFKVQTFGGYHKNQVSSALEKSIQEEKIETIVEYGLHQFVTQFIRKISSVDNEIHKEFFN